MYEISNDLNTANKRIFEQCELQYSFQNSARALPVSSILKQLELPFDRWSQANDYLSFERVSPGDSAQIRFVFADSLPVARPKRYTTYGLVGQPIEVLSQLVRRPNGTCLVYLLNTHAWKPEELQRVLLFQIGAALGLATSSRPTSAMRTNLSTATTEPDSSDAKAIKQLYNQPCDQWTRLADVPFRPNLVETVVGNSGCGYVFLNQNNALWEFNPVTKRWNSRLPYPTVPTISTHPDNWLAFAIDSTVFLGQAYNLSWKAGKKGTFWRYVPVESPGGERWVRLDSIPQIGWGNGYCFIINKTGYLVTTNNSSVGRQISVCTYDPVLNKWGGIMLYQEPTGFSISGMSPFALGMNIYFLTSKSSFYKSWRFSTTSTPPFVQTPSFEEVFRPTSFSIRNAGYVVGGNTFGPKSVAQYRPEQPWKRMRDLPAQGNTAFSFVVGNRAYLVTDVGQFWEYRP
ncbi:MAG: hypothetical protein EAZ91_18960 [Cytophagales bacterium]|nr:MAG: hypothetical protein EAZ91_18960 [Cytophagales bacterium]